MNLAFLLHIYQPPNQQNRVVKEITEASYLPLIKLLKSNSILKLTLNIPLSLSYQLQENGYTQLLSDIKDLYENEKIELTSTGAYHTLLTRVPEELMEKEILLNEYGLGYYFGKDKGFEGEDALLIKNVNGFFPPEMAINMHVLKYLDKLGYSWVAVDENAIDYRDKMEGTNTIYNVEGLNIKVAVRNKELSDILSFTRSSEVDPFINKVLELRHEGKDAIIALDGEFFGHHFKEGVYHLEALVEKLSSLGVNFSTVGSVVEGWEDEKPAIIKESTWGAAAQDIKEGNIYPLWDVSGNEVQKLQWELFDRVANVKTGFGAIEKTMVPDHDLILETLPVWDTKRLDDVKDIKLKNDLFRQILHMQCLNSDQFWWSSNKEIEGVLMYSPEYVERSLELYMKFALVSEDPDLANFVQEKSAQIREKL